ncbi:LysR family transcriptional regulator [Pseudonocardia sp. CA-142604]|uniref:LysR family transcriptional regulator n=1 Tax=Pseudonocardia sp. CA-142604 TaxID=3240024 RepID=UPI003D8E1C8A
MEIRELRAFVAVAEERGLSAAARKLHVSQSALSQTVQSLERQLGVQLLVRNRTGSSTTDAGDVLVREARGLIEHHDRATAAVAAAGAVESQATARLIRIGAPLELPPDRLPTALGQLAVVYPDTRVTVVHSSSASQLDAVRAGELDVGLVRDRPNNPLLDAVLAVRESMGVILAAVRAEEIGDPSGVPLQKLVGLHWMGFARSDSPAWHDQVTATLRAHGIAVDNQPDDDRPVTAEVKLGGIGTGKAFGFASPSWAQALPEGLVWYPLADNPIVRRTWAIWQAAARHRDIAALIDILDISGR